MPTCAICEAEISEAELQNKCLQKRLCFECLEILEEKEEELQRAKLWVVLGSIVLVVLEILIIYDLIERGIYGWSFDLSSLIGDIGGSIIIVGSIVIGIVAYQGGKKLKEIPIIYLVAMIAIYGWFFDSWYGITLFLLIGLYAGLIVIGIVTYQRYKKRKNEDRNKEHMCI